MSLVCLGIIWASPSWVIFFVIQLFHHLLIFFLQILLNLIHDIAHFNFFGEEVFIHTSDKVDKGILACILIFGCGDIDEKVEQSFAIVVIIH